MDGQSTRQEYPNLRFRGLTWRQSSARNVIAMTYRRDQKCPVIRVAFPSQMIIKVDKKVRLPLDLSFHLPKWSTGCWENAERMILVYEKIDLDISACLSQHRLCRQIPGIHQKPHQIHPSRNLQNVLGTSLPLPVSLSPTPLPPPSPSPLVIYAFLNSFNDLTALLYASSTSGSPDAARNVPRCAC